MNRLARGAQVLFALALVGMGITHVGFRAFTTGQAPPWPESVPGGVAWAYITGVVLIAVAIAVLDRRRGRAALLLAAALVFGWALLRHIPIIAASPFPSGDWTRAGKALRFVGGALAVAATMPGWSGGPHGRALTFLRRDTLWILTGRVCLGLSLLLNGIQHFVFTDFVASLIPAWFPGDAVLWTRFAGVALIAGGSGLLVPVTAALAALLSGLMVFSWLWIIHLPRTFLSVDDGISVFGALATSSSLFAIAAFLFMHQGAPVRDPAVVDQTIRLGP